MKRLLSYSIAATVFAACSGHHDTVPEAQDGPLPVLSPDYAGVTLPVNIAPARFLVKGEIDSCIARLSGPGGNVITVSGPDVCWPEEGWRTLLEESRGDSIECEIFIKRQGARTWEKSRFAMLVDSAGIDRWISYRLIEPSFVGYGPIAINQRDLTSYDEKPIVCTRRSDRDGEMSCINCHVPRNYNRTGETQFHVREHGGGTVIVRGDSIRKYNLRTDSTGGAGVYQAWHPTLDLIVYSVNATRQNFFTHSPQKVEVYDETSHLIMFDPVAGTVSNIVNTPGELSTFPSWSHDGKKLYYSSAAQVDSLPADYDRIRYDILALDFDIATRRFSTVPDTIFKASAIGKSASLPRISPDGSKMVTCVGDHGTFHIWHSDADLWITDLTTGESKPMTAANSPAADSYHTWSSDGRWILFSSRRGDGSYTRPYIARVYDDGTAAKAFAVPQPTGDYYDRLMKSYNVPEFMVAPVKVSSARLMKSLEEETTPVEFSEEDFR